MMLKRIPSDLKISLIYIIIGFLWIKYSDKALHLFVNNEEQYYRLEVYKGWFFVTVTGFLLYLLINKELKRRNKILRELRDSKNKAEESDKLKTAFLSNLSHYLRTPMNSILGFVDLLQNRNLDQIKQAKFLSIINEQSNHLLLFISNIIEISKLHGKQTTVNVTEFKLNDLLTKLYIRYHTEIEYLNKKNLIQLNMVNDSPEAILKNDPSKIEYIFTNLLNNAIKFTNAGKIDFGYKTSKTGHVFFVADTGCGIDPEKHSLITETFMHADPDLNQENIGTGLGLAITNGLIKLLNGQLWIEKSDNTGTEMCFYIPLNYDLKKMENGL
jgi:signal transduction histidine kinase